MSAGNVKITRFYQGMKVEKTQEKKKKI